MFKLFSILFLHYKLACVKVRTTLISNRTNLIIFFIIQISNECDRCSRNVQYNAVQCSSVNFNDAQCSAVERSAAHCSRVKCSAVLGVAVQ